MIYYIIAKSQHVLLNEEIHITNWGIRLNMKKYSSNIKSMGLLYHETKKTAQLLIDGLTPEEVKAKAVQDNIFLLKTEKRRIEVAWKVLERLKVIDDYLLAKIATSNLGESKLLVLLTVIKTDKLFFEFMYEVFMEKLILRDYRITGMEFSSFFQRKSEQSDKVAGWSDRTYNDLATVYKKILTEAGMGKEENGNFKINKAVFNHDTVSDINRSGDQAYLKVMTGGM